MDVNTVSHNDPGFTVSRNVTKRKLEYASDAWNFIFKHFGIIHRETQHLGL